MQERPLFLATICSVSASVAFQLTLALFPEKLRPYSWGVKWVWAIAAFFAVIYIFNKLIASTRAVSKDEAEPLRTPQNNFNVNINPNITVSPPISVAGQRNEDSGDKAVKQRPKPRSTAAKPPLMEAAEYSLIFVGLKVLSARFGAGDIFLEGGKETVLAGSFRNQPVVGKKISVVESIRAHIVYRDRDDRELLSVPQACWLNHADGVVDIAAGHTMHVILAAYNSVGWASVWNQNVSSKDAWNQSSSLRDNALGSGAMTAEIHLIDDHGVSLMKVRVKFHLERSGIVVTDENDVPS